MSNKNNNTNQDKSKWSEIDHQILKSFEIKKRLGKGAYGIVWKALDRRTQQIVAVKKIFDAFRNETDAQRTFREIMFLREFRNHPNIIQLYSIHKAVNNMDIYLSFEFMESDLHNVIKRGSILKDIHKRYVMYQLFNATKYIHSGNVIHRDMKPSNILVDSKCRCKIADFGLARSVSQQFQKNDGSHNDSLEPLLTDYVATRWYRAPEILVASKRYTKGIDMWSLGCILGEMIRGKPLFPGSCTVNQVERIVSALPKVTDMDITAVGLSFGAVLLNQPIQPNNGNLKIDELIFGSPDDAKHLIKSLLVLDPIKRLTAKEALTHKYVEKFRNSIVEAELNFDILPPFRDDIQLSVSEYRTKLYQIMSFKEVNLKKNESRSEQENSMNLESSIVVTSSNGRPPIIDVEPSQTAVVMHKKSIFTNKASADINKTLNPSSSSSSSLLQHNNNNNSTSSYIIGDNNNNNNNGKLLKKGVKKNFNHLQPPINISQNVYVSNGINAVNRQGKNNPNNKSIIISHQNNNNNNNVTSVNNNHSNNNNNNFKIPPKHFHNNNTTNELYQSSEKYMKSTNHINNNSIGTKVSISKSISNSPESSNDNYDKNNNNKKTIPNYHHNLNEQHLNKDTNNKSKSKIIIQSRKNCINNTDNNNNNTNIDRNNIMELMRRNSIDSNNTANNNPQYKSNFKSKLNINDRRQSFDNALNVRCNNNNNNNCLDYNNNNNNTLINGRISTNSIARNNNSTNYEVPKNNNNRVIQLNSNNAISNNNNDTLSKKYFKKSESNNNNNHFDLKQTSSSSPIKTNTITNSTNTITTTTDNYSSRLKTLEDKIRKHKIDIKKLVTQNVNSKFDGTLLNNHNNNNNDQAIINNDSTHKKSIIINQHSQQKLEKSAGSNNNNFEKNTKLLNNQKKFYETQQINDNIKIRMNNFGVISSIDLYKLRSSTAEVNS